MLLSGETPASVLQKLQNANVKVEAKL